MTTYTYSEARQKLAKLLNTAKRDGKVIIKRRDGSVFELRPIQNEGSPLDVEGVDIQISKAELNSLMREIRSRK